MQQDSIDCAAQAREKFNIEKDIAACELSAPARTTWPAQRVDDWACSCGSAWRRRRGAHYLAAAAQG